MTNIMIQPIRAQYIEGPGPMRGLHSGSGRLTLTLTGEPRQGGGRGGGWRSQVEAEEKGRAQLVVSTSPGPRLLWRRP